MSTPTPFDSIVAPVLEGRAPQHVRLAAARGALPLPRGTLVRLQVALLADADAGIKASAEQSLAGLGGEELREVLGDDECAPEVMRHFAKRASRDEVLAERIAFHRATPPEAMQVLAAGGNAAVIELVLTNQELLLQRPALLERLMLNPALRADQRGRILELLERAARSEEAGEGQGDDPADAAGGEDVEEAARLLDVDVGELMSASEILGGEEFEESEDLELRSAYQKIITLNAAQKAILAMKGGREERTILIRDTNKIVALGVLKNPRLNENEVESIARMRNVSDEVLRAVGNTREWTKSYTVIVGLVNNPRTPQTVSSNFIPRLTNRDLKHLSDSRDVPELIRRMAKRTLETRTQRASSRFKKKH